MAFDINDLLKDVTGLTDEQKSLLQSTLSNPTLKQRLEEGQLRQSDYSRLAQEAQEKIKRSTEYYNELVQWKEQEAARLASQGGNQPSNAGEGGGDPEYLTTAEYQKRIQQLEAGAMGYMEVLSQTAMKHYQEFGEILDVQAVRNKAGQEGTNFAIAYDRFVQPQREAKAKVALEERIKREREEAAKEALANVTIPTGQQIGQGLAGGNPHVLDMVADKTKSFGWKAAADAHTRDIMAGTVKRD